MAGPLTSIVQVKEYEETYLPLFLWEFTFTDGSWAGFCTHGLHASEHGFQYQGRDYEGLVLNGDVAAAQAISSNGVTMFPSLQLELDDASRTLTQNIEIEGPGFKGATVLLRFLFYDPTTTTATGAFSVDDLPLFLGSCITSPAIDDATLRVTIQSLLHLAQGTLPCIHLQKRCPWIHPNTPEEKAEADRYESWFYNCGDTSTASGHDHCDYTPDDCKRLGMWDPLTNIFRFGGIEAEPPPTWTGKPFGGDTETRDNAKNHTLDSDFVPHMYGRGWIEPIVLNMSGEANYTRMQLLVCYGQTMDQIGAGYFSPGWKLAINDCVVGEAAANTPSDLTRNGFWGFVSTGKRDGRLCDQVGYQVSDGKGGVTGGGDPFGSMTVIYAAVLRRVTESNQLPSVQLLCDGGRIPVFHSDDPTDFTLFSTRNPVWQTIDLLMWGGRSYSDLRLSTFRAIAALADEYISANDRNGVAGNRARFESCIIARHPRAIGDILQGVLGSFGGYLVTTDKIELRMYQTLASEQPSPIPGSNDNTAYSTAGAIGGFTAKTTKGQPGTGYVAYSFDSSNIKEVSGHTSLKRLGASPGDQPNTFSYTFQDSQNDFQLDTLTIPDVDAIKRNSGQQIVAQAPFEGITTYDQAFRMGRRNLAVRLRGNPQGDPRGTWRMSLTASVKAVSLRLGHLVLLTAPEFNLNKQLFRIEEIKPALNFEEADLVVSWHEDTFYQDDYGISDIPSISGSRQESNRTPRVWQPYDKLIPADDLLDHGDPAFTFAMRQWLRDGELLTDSMIRIQGHPPITMTAAMDIQPPWFTDQDLVLEAGGTLTPDQLYYVCICVNDSNWKFSSPSTIRRVYVPAGANLQFRIQNLFWRGGNLAYVFIGKTLDRLSWCKTVAGQPASIVIGDTAVPNSSWGPPDAKAHHYVIRWRESIHAGLLGGRIAQVMQGGTSLQITSAAFVTDEWKDRILSVIGDANAPSTGDYFEVVNRMITGNDADTLFLAGSDDLSTHGVEAGDAIVIRAMANIVSPTTIGDSKFLSSYAPEGMNDEVIGREVVILWGKGKGQRRTISDHDDTSVTVAPEWETLPDATSVFVIEEIGWQTQETAPILCDLLENDPVTITDVPVQNWAARTVRVEVNISDSVGKVAVEALSREIYLYATFDEANLPGGEGAPPEVSITKKTVREIYDGMYEVSVFWAQKGTDAVHGINAYLEDPDVSEKVQAPMNNSVQLNASAQVSGRWSPRLVDESYESPTIIQVPSDVVDRNIRIYCQAFSKGGSSLKLLRANRPGPTANVQVLIPAGSGTRVSGEEFAWNVTGAEATVVEDFENPSGPMFRMQFSFIGPDLATPLPPGLNPFAGVTIEYEYPDEGNRHAVAMFLDQNKPDIPGAEGGQPTWISMNYEAHTSHFYVWFRSTDNKGNVNSIVKGVTPMVDCQVTYPPAGEPSAPFITDFVLSNYRHEPQPDGTDIARADLTWTNPDTPRFASVDFYRTGVTPPRNMNAKSSPPVSSVTISVIDWPKQVEQWTIVAISTDSKGKASSDAAAPGTGTPSVIWNIGPPTLGTPGGGQEYAPIGGVSGTTITTIQEQNSDGVVMMRHKIVGWQNPTDNLFGGMSIARVFAGETTWWDVPKGETSFTTDWEPAPTARTWDFYFVSRDMAGHRNTINPATTPHISHAFTPIAGNVLASRLPKDWFNEAEFEWPAGAAGKFTVERIVAPKIYVGSILRVGGGPSTAGSDGLFEGMYNGQVAVYNASNVLRAWAGQQDGVGTPDNPTAHSIFGGWFAELYVGGDGPPTAPLYATQAGAVIVGGFEMTGPRYPYISIRDNTGNECGRIGARLGYSASGNQGGPEVTIQGAWFREFAYGGQSFADWRMLAKMDASAPLQATVQMRQIDKFTIDYMANYPTTANPNNARMQLEFGFQAFVTDNPNDNSYWKFPGISLWRGTPTQPAPRHGIAIINRGIVLRGPNNVGGMGGRVAALVSYNGDDKGQDILNNWWGMLTMYSYQNGAINVQLDSGNSSNGSSSFTMRDGAGNLNFSVGTGGEVYIRGAVTGINSLSLSTLTVSGQSNLAGVSCSSLNTNGGSITAGQINASSSPGSFASLNVSGTIQCGTLIVTTFSPSTINANTIQTSGTTRIDSGGIHYCTQVYVGGNQRIDSTGVYRGSLQFNDHVYAGDFGIMANGANGPTGAVGVTGTFYDRDGKLIKVAGGIVIGIT
jgi:hypothetical protein